MLKLNNLTYSIGNFKAKYNLSLSKTGIYALVGESGSGKSTLINLLGGFLKQEKGNFTINNKTISNLIPSKRPISTLFQNHNNFDHLNIFQNIIMGIDPNMKLNDSNLKKVSSVMKKLSLKMNKLSLVSDLSGGEQQRVSLARCWLRNENLLLLDEPFNSLDPGLRKDLFKQLVSFHRLNQNLITIISSHFLDELLHVVEGIIFISNGRIESNQVIRYKDILGNINFQKYFLGNSK
jgi:thiamine transport system ATP-binding protein